MIKCNRCGNTNTAGAVRCQSCGSALSGMDTGGNSSNVMSQEQSALPAWLESLRVGERATRPATDSPQFSTADLIEEGSLPSWMHAQRNETQDVTGANLPVSLRPSSLAAPGTDGGPFPATSFAAHSLIDEQSLPSWMQEGEAPTSLPPENGVSAGNLVDKDSVPDWMKSLQQQQPVVPGLGQPKQAASTESTVKQVEPGLPSPPLASGFSARDLVDQQSLPPWLSQMGNQSSAPSASRDQLGQPSTVNEQPQPIQPGQMGFSARDLVDQQSLPPWLSQMGNQSSAPSASRDQLGQPSTVNEQPQPIQPGQMGFSARDLVDQQSLPPWMASQSGHNAAAPANSEQQKQSNPSGSGLPASSLLDMSALPSWLAQNGQAQAVSPAYPQPPASMAPSNQPWPPQQPSAQGSPADFSSMQGGRLAASSVIDMNALPEWLRSSGGGQQSASEEASSQSYSAQYAGGSSRVENVRVPSRPRSEMSSSETSEMAASVFASMLGVASTAPNFPPAPTGAPYQQQPGQPSHVEQMTLSGVSGIAGMPGQAGMSMVGVSNWGGANMAGMPGGPGAHSMAGMPGGPGAHSMAGMPGGPGAHSMAGMPGGPGAHSMAGMPGGPGAHNMAGNAYRNPTGELTGPNAQGMAGEEKNTKKRGLFGALLDWLSR